jgi:serine/threonine protein kinase
LKLLNQCQGTKGDVHLVRDTRSGRLMAMKTVARNFKRTPIPVRHFSTSADQSFLLRPRYVLQPPGSTHILVDYVHGGELFQKRWPRGQFTEEQIRFSLSEVLLALGDLHRSGVQDYDLRPKKVLLDARGHVVLLDFGLVQTAEMYFERTSEKSYTPPEILSGGEIDRRGNFWALGVMLYEMSVLGINQLHDIKAKKINQMIEEGDIRFPPLGFLSDEGKDLCRRLLVRDPWARLGSRDGVLEIMKHTFFSSVDWTSLRQKRNIPPWEQVFSLPFVTAVKFERVATHIQSKEAKDEPKVSNEPDSPTILRPDDVSSDFNVSGDQNIPVEDKLGLSVDSNSLSSYRTALSSLGRGTFATPPSRYQSFDPGSGPIKDGLLSQMLRNKKPLSSLHSTSKSTYSTLLRDKGLLLPPSEQLDWSGKGQHVEFALGEEIPLKPLAAIGHGGSAIVDGVLCRRIKLARKTMVCSRRQKLEDVINEVEHLQRLRHPHIIQLVGSYLQGKKFAILLYPVAEWNLSSFFELCGRENTNSTWPLTRQACLTALAGFSQCLAHALSYVHSNTMKHLDIKPQNVLVRRVDKYKEPFRVYL